MSIGHSNVRSSIGRTEMSIGHSNVHSSIGQTEMSTGHSYVHSSIGRTEMSIGHPNVQLSIGRMDEWTLSNSKHSSLLSTWGQTQSDYVITASLWTNRNVHWTSKCPFVHWTNGHCLMASTLVSYPHRVRLSQITSLQLPWHCKRYMSIGHI